MQDTTLTTDTAHSTANPANQLFELLYGELRALARSQLKRHDQNALLNTTTLVHESYLRFLNQGNLTPEDRAHFLAYASHVMRSIIVDVARRHLASKRGSGRADVTLNTDIADRHAASDEQLVRLHDSLKELEVVEPRLAKVVEMRYFGGWQEDEIAAALNVNVRTIQRDWEKARLLLTAAMKN